ncbi:hypothetical protein NECAME_05167 [Necator americanus]|uniref:Uncharacterized protein n=1 Tax=Necator americanus TaxID=51031 RepID=W2SJ43_NECAM|nr:hypothetical protein NECAME_05167 [Necator americanus]ETN69588.1 hypothetical protein NECAME_05167 [Necator americanus]
MPQKPWMLRPEAISVIERAVWRTAAAIHHHIAQIFHSRPDKLWTLFPNCDSHWFTIIPSTY